jgi:hypothetical protein
MQLLRELALGKDYSTVPLVTMLKNSKGTVIGKLLRNKYFELYKNSKGHFVLFSENKYVLSHFITFNK